MARGTTPARGALWTCWCGWTFAMLALLLAPALPAHAQPMDRRLVEAAYVLNFLRFSAWPDDQEASSRPLQVVVLGPREAARALRSIVAEAQGKGTLPRPVRVVHVADVGSEGSLEARLARSLEGAHAVFVAEPGHRLAPLVVAETRKRPLLSIGIGAAFARAGGMLALVESAGRLGFTCNEAAILHSQVVVSAKVLRIARPLDSSSALDAPARGLLAGAHRPAPGAA